ncbi:LacI family DNA-binding transcriptional regulator [Kocuria turfanensis]|uniref:LacI family transcriptional regulator n=1 Tax=Kocuria turfanensis TaxID=388357 RepID=A0A512III2_9MICC|nr:LacI family DNA-binding transcriptional regulator [Kocuria turfanensis]GEO97525.1 LacI family transcriptional regulator [Kocuria turfanensis]
MIPQKTRPATIADVARRAGVSKSSAARALGSYGTVSAAAREKVQAAAEELGYRPNVLARSINTGETKTIGVVVGDIENDYFGLATRGISDIAKKAGYDVILINTSENPEAEVDAVRILLEKRVDGLIVAPATALVTDHLQDTHRAGVPLVLLDRQIETLPAVSASVHIAPAAKEATSTLLAAGHRRIAFISSLQTHGETYRPGMRIPVSSVQDRLTGIVDGLQQYGVEPTKDLIRFNALGERVTARIIDELLALESPPTAILASDGLIALDVLLALQHRNLEIPKNMSFVMFDDARWAQLMTPPLSVIAQPIYEVGVSAATALLQVLAGAYPAASPARLKARFINRKSICPPSE